MGVPVSAPGAVGSLYRKVRPMTINLNDMVRVTLTPAGVQLLAEWRRALRLGPASGIEWTGMMWELMSIWGPAMHCGADTPFVESRIEVVP